MGTRAFAAPGRFWRGNLHMHSTLSDGQLPPEEVCRLYREAGYDFICLSDHFLEEYRFPIADTRRLRTNSFTTLLGAEVHAPENSHGQEWHILAVGLPEDFPSTGPAETGIELAARAKAAGAFVAIAHPQWSGLTGADGRALAPHVHAVEIYNHGCWLECARGDGNILLEELLNAGHRLAGYAADDSHFRMDDGFGGWTMVKAEANEPVALLAALKAGHFYASQGPEIHAFELVGGMAEIECSPVVNAAIVGRGYRVKHTHGRQFTRASLSLAPFAGDWLRLVVTDAAGRSAWSNPVWLS
jgi:hypothetical protein